MKLHVSLYVVLFVQEMIATTTSPPKDDDRFCSFTFCPPLMPSVPGVPGVPGTHGIPGPPGPAGPKGMKGDEGTSIERTQGDPGPIGPTGEKGEEGREGQEGRKGDKGEPGQTGPTVLKETKGYGNPGAPGEKGDKGEAGAPPLSSQSSMGNSSGSTRRTVAFTATRTSSFRANAGDIILFPPTDVITNVGGTFDGDTGIFTSKYTGVHFFLFSLYRVTAIKDIAVSLVHDGRVVVTATSGALNGEPDQVTSGAVLGLDVGDHVWLEIVYDGTTISSDDKRFTSFTGFML